MFGKRREDRRALVGRLYDEHGASLYRYALMLLADHASAEDAVQHVFTAVLRGSGVLDNEAHYLRRAVRNACYSSLGAERGHSADERPLVELAIDDPVGAEDRILLERALQDAAGGSARSHPPARVRGDDVSAGGGHDGGVDQHDRESLPLRDCEVAQQHRECP